jgi:hypothetical protein
MRTGKAKYDSIAWQQKANYQWHREDYLKQKKATYRQQKGEQAKAAKGRTVP